MNVGDLTLKIILETAGADAKAQQFTTTLKNVEGQANRTSAENVRLGSSVQNVGLTFFSLSQILNVVTRAYDMLKSGIGAAIGEFERQEIANSKLMRGLNNVNEGMAAYNKLTSQAGELQKVTPFADEEIQNAQAMLTTFMKQSDEIEVLTPRILDLAAAYMQNGDSSMSLQQIAVMVGKVNEETIGALRRVGVAFTAEQEQMLKTTRGLEQANILAKILDQNFKGMAETVGSTFAGQVKIAKNLFGEFLEVIGGFAANYSKPFIQFFKELIPLMQQGGNELMNFIDDTKNLTAEILGGTKTAADFKKEIIDLVQNGFQFLMSTLRELRPEFLYLVRSIKDFVDGNPQFIADLKIIGGLLLDYTVILARLSFAPLTTAIKTFDLLAKAIEYAVKPLRELWDLYKKVAGIKGEEPMPDSPTDEDLLGGAPVIPKTGRDNGPVRVPRNNSPSSSKDKEKEQKESILTLDKFLQNLKARITAQEQLLKLGQIDLQQFNEYLKTQLALLQSKSELQNVTEKNLSDEEKALVLETNKVKYLEAEAELKKKILSDGAMNAFRNGGNIEPGNIQSKPLREIGLTNAQRIEMQANMLEEAQRKARKPFEDFANASGAFSNFIGTIGMTDNALGRFAGTISSGINILSSFFQFLNSIGGGNIINSILGTALSFVPGGTVVAGALGGGPAKAGGSGILGKSIGNYFSGGRGSELYASSFSGRVYANYESARMLNAANEAKLKTVYIPVAAVGNSVIKGSDIHTSWKIEDLKIKTETA